MAEEDRAGERAIAIDGPSASGKSTVARLVAAALDRRYVDSGAFYRGMTWKLLQEGVSVGDRDAVAVLLDSARWLLRMDEGSVRYAIDGVSPGVELRGEAVREAVSDVAALPEVRQFLVGLLRRTVAFGDVVMEGRDIGTVVFPESRFKFYLDASAEERARRRLGDIVAMEGRGDVSEVQASLLRRDAKDRTRQTAPLQIALNAVVIDSTGLSAAETADRILARVRADGGADDA